MKIFTLIYLIIPLSSLCMNISKKEANTIFDMEKNTELLNFLKEKEYRNYPQKDLERFIKEMVKSKIDINAVQVNTEPAYLNSLEYGNIDTTLAQHKSTPLGYCTCRDRYDMSGYILADVLVSNGARLSGSYDDKFGFYFIKRVIGSAWVSRDLKTPTTKIFETLLYRRVAYCVQKSISIYLIAHRIKSKIIYPNLPSAIPKFVIDKIADFIINDGVLDVMNVCNEEFIETYKEFESGKEKTAAWTMFKYWQKFLENIQYIPEWQPTLKSLNAQEWQHDFSEFMQKKRKKEWQPGDSNLILHSLRHKTEN